MEVIITTLDVILPLHNNALTGVNGLLTLSSVPVSEDGQSVTVCPHTRVTLTCTATQIISLTWADQNGDIVTFARNDNSTVFKSPYILTNMEENDMGAFADFTSTLEVIVDDTIDNGTNITCRTVFNEEHLLLYRKGIGLILSNYILLHYNRSSTAPK